MDTQEAISSKSELMRMKRESGYRDFSDTQIRKGRSWALHARVTQNGYALYKQFLYLEMWTCVHTSKTRRLLLVQRFTQANARLVKKNITFSTYNNI